MLFSALYLSLSEHSTEEDDENEVNNEPTIDLLAFQKGFSKIWNYYGEQIKQQLWRYALKTRKCNKRRRLSIRMKRNKKL